ncbi:MAG TPA: MerR family transcriptional regulator [bacterium]|jgi:DNA-binding transcriptional MerR regulator|nr:MerR family transcriptional regulator [bacterium]
MSNDEKLFYSIGEVAEILQLKAYVLRYWETEFKKLNPQKSFTGQRTYRPKDIQVALTIKKLLYDDKYTIAGALQKLEELEANGGLVAFSGSNVGAATTESKPAEAPAEAVISSSETKPKLDVQKVKDLKTLMEATKNLLKKYNLS